jgi:hypothetical protein
LQDEFKKGSSDCGFKDRSAPKLSAAIILTTVKGGHSKGGIGRRGNEISLATILLALPTKNIEFFQNLTVRGGVGDCT